ncbi:hypothetical protein [Frigoriglobus tundricola]|uniref:Uncharacterized protein n=1 Tax=Frigoriglobus tundricola TaxID=2774151 RepID=A0A6M5Z4B3_9BACT|nr:hypothetical protein [Frigoriglobus tundricola]QJX00304.1 hypothetical protein FTUN_7929 [Frigoriglobus tundricola]
MPPSAFPSDLESWLIAITQHTRETKEAFQVQGERQKKQDAEPAWVDKLAKKFETFTTTIAARGLGQANALATKGFAGTVEQARYDFAMEQLGRQFAAVMSPVLNGMTYAAQQFEMRMRGWNGTEQNRVMGGVLGAGLGYKLGGLPGLLAGGAIGGAVGGSLSSRFENDALGGAAAGPRPSAPVSAGSARGSVPPWVRPPAARKCVEGEKPSDYYKRERETGSSRLGAAWNTFGAELSAIGGSAARTVGFDSDVGKPASRAEYEKSRAKPPEPRTVTPYNPAMVGAGESYFKIQESVIRATAGAGAEENNPLKPIIDGIGDIIKLLAKLAGVSFEAAPGPTSATGTIPAGVPR